jgi:hypothetical protein
MGDVEQTNAKADGKLVKLRSLLSRGTMTYEQNIGKSFFWLHTPIELIL